MTTRIEKALERVAGRSGVNNGITYFYPQLRSRLAGPCQRNFETRSACSRMTRALSSLGVPVGSPL